MSIKIKPLPFSQDALDPVISSQTLFYHYEKHHKGYVTKLNKMLEDADEKFKSMDLENLIKYAEGPMWNNAAQHYNHEFYWESLSPQKQDIPEQLRKMIENSFDSIDIFLEKIVQEAISLFGSGWVWITSSGNQIKLEKTTNANLPKNKPLLVLDVWEHAYYLDYQQDRPSHIKKMLDILNWDKALERLGQEYFLESK